MFGDKRRPSATIAAEIDRIIGLNIRRAREDVRLGQHEMAALLGIPVHVLARYEEGQDRTPASVLLELTRHLGCQLTDLFAGMPSLEVEDEFPGSRPAGLPPEPAAELPSHSAPSQAPGAVANPSANSGPFFDPGHDAAATSHIIQAYAALKSATVRERLLSLLQALG